MKPGLSTDNLWFVVKVGIFKDDKGFVAKGGALDGLGAKIWDSWQMRNEVIAKATTFDRRGRSYREPPRFPAEQGRGYREKPEREKDFVFESPDFL